MAGMKIGVILGFGAATPPDQIASTARAVDESGVHSIWMPEHVVFFREYESRYPYAADGAIPGRPDGVLEPLTRRGVAGTDAQKSAKPVLGEAVRLRVVRVAALRGRLLGRGGPRSNRS